MPPIIYPRKFVRFDRTYDNQVSIDNARNLVKLWTEAEADPNSMLMPIEADTVRRVLAMSKSEMELEINKKMTKEFKHFDRVSKEIESLVVFWERIVWIKKRLDFWNRQNENGERREFRGEDTMDAQCCLLGLTIIPRRLNIGLGYGKFNRKYGRKDGEDVTDFTEDEGDDNKREDGSSDTAEDEPERGRTTKRWTRPGKALRDASEESAARRRRQSDKDKEPESTAAEDSAISKESAILKKGKRSGRKNSKGYAKIKAENTQRIQKIIKEEMMLNPQDPEYWEGRVPKMFNKKYDHLNYWPGRKSTQDSTNAKESGASDNESTAGEESKSVATEDSASSSEESTVSRKRQRQKTDIPWEKTTTQASSSTGRPRNTSKRLIQKSGRGKSTKHSQSAKESAASEKVEVEEELPSKKGFTQRKRRLRDFPGIKGPPVSAPMEDILNYSSALSSRLIERNRTRRGKGKSIKGSVETKGGKTKGSDETKDGGQNEGSGETKLEDSSPSSDD